jgi:glycosyltransferase involved in cell wall biosynthesis
LKRHEGRIRVLHLIETLGSGGAERLLFTNLKHLDPGEVQSHVLTVFSRGDYWTQKILELGVEVGSLECSSFMDIVTGIRRLLPVIERTRPDVIHTHLWTANVIGRIAGRLAGVPVVSSIHNPEYEPEAMAGVSRPKVFIARNIDKWTARFGCSRMIAVSNYVRESASEKIGFPLGKIDLIYNPLDIEESNLPVTDGFFDSKIGLPSDATVIVSVGRLSPQKGFFYAVKAMEHVRKLRNNVHLVHVGAQDNTEYLTEIRAVTARCDLTNYVHLIGERRDVHEFLGNAVIFLFPSLYEGLGIALAEAMAAGLPVISSNIRPIDEFVEDGRNGLLVPSADHGAISAAVIKLLGSASIRKELGENARRTAQAKFQPDRAAQRLAEVYQMVAA